MFCCGFGFERPRSEAAHRAPADRTGSAPAAGNAAFEEYRADTLRRLEQEQREFHGFLDRLRIAKDKSEFDQFMAERRARAETPQSQP